MSKKLIFIFAIFIFTVSAQAQQKYIASLSGSQMLPPNNSGGGGKCVLEINETEFQAAATCSYENLAGNASVFGIGFVL